MFTPEKRQVTWTTHEYVVPNGSTARDLMDSVFALEYDLKEMKGEKAANWDDAWHVRSTDEAVVLYFETHQ